MNRFWDKVNKTDSCWIWTVGLRSKNAPYGCIRINGKNILAHRYSYETLIGPIPTGLTLDHLCKNKLCVNPRHLEPVTLTENVNRAKNWIKGCIVVVQNQLNITTCPRGHIYDGKTEHQRTCSKCKRINYRAWYHKQKKLSGHYK